MSARVRCGLRRLPFRIVMLRTGTWPTQRAHLVRGEYKISGFEKRSGINTHGQEVPQSFRFLRRSLARSAHDAAERYAQGEYPQARFLLQ